MRAWVSNLKRENRLFDAFYTTKSGGMGIGLSVSRSIIESHHGRLWATPNDGPGATFSFSIPQQSERSDVRGHRGTTSDAWCEGYAARYEEFVMAKRSLVSVVDDDESVRESLPDLLREFGFAVQAFSSAEEFLASHYVCQTRCLILDIAMPGMSGPALQQELMRRRKKIPIVFITAHGGEDRSSATTRSKAPWNACPSHSATRLSGRHSTPRFERNSGAPRSCTRGV